MIKCYNEWSPYQNPIFTLNDKAVAINLNNKKVISHVKDTLISIYVTKAYRPEG